ncbi:hypothetical protein GCM10007977_072840 [Dactylosporangium sucinum]|uniref:Uncharacterized protein n=1 Tax=Dactylosporangium sucinum TaxID=1424081 RepID=A0A917X3F9_9ACTN|nr:hypothetical protein GCM10007977_072840 [Dactylosporangium sucinum]
MTAGWLRALLTRGEWRPSTDERSAANYLLAHLSWSPEDDSLAARQRFAAQAVATIRGLVQQSGPSFYRSEPASLYSVLGALIAQMSPLQLPLDRAAGSDLEAWMLSEVPDLRIRLSNAEVSVSELRDLLNATIAA